jgi:ferritin-like protein
MGGLGRQFAHVNRASLLRELARAYADEWFAHDNYQFTANALWGHHSPSTTTLLSRKSAEASRERIGLRTEFSNWGAYRSVNSPIS